MIFVIFQVVEFDKTPFPLLTGAVPMENSMKIPKKKLKIDTPDDQQFHYWVFNKRKQKH